jgi:hypothetical protein
VRPRALTAVASAATPRSGLAAAITGVARAQRRVDDVVPAGRFGERTMDENDRGLHEEVPSLGVIRVARVARIGRPPAKTGQRRKL